MDTDAEVRSDGEEGVVDTDAEVRSDGEEGVVDTDAGQVRWGGGSSGY